MPNRIDEKRWLEAQAAERVIWDGDLRGGWERVHGGLVHDRHAPVMLLTEESVAKKWVVDIGGGAVSMMFDYPVERGVVVDPILFPQVYLDKYQEKDFQVACMTAEEFLGNIPESYEYENKDNIEVWIYNCLQHVIDPEFILRNVAKIGSVLRISEPCNVPTDTVHPHLLTPEWLYEILADISTEHFFREIRYDYLYAGGKCLLK